MQRVRRGRTDGEEISFAPLSGWRGLGQLPPQDRVRLELDQDQLAQLITYADAQRRSVTGRLVYTTPDSVAVILRTPASYTQVSIPRRSILRMERGKADAKKNVLVSAVVVGGVAALAVAGFEGRDQGPAGDGNGIDESIVQFLGLRLPFRIGIGR